MKIIKKRSELMKIRTDKSQLGQQIGFVPTMGAIHDGHLALVQAAKQKADFVIVSIFVNPTQFAPDEDFDSYPRDYDSDIDSLKRAGADAVYLPNTSDIYPDNNATDIQVRGLSQILEGDYRPHFFAGVTNVVARLFAHVQPDVAVFGEKDFQQLQIIRRMVHDIGLPIDIVGLPTIRESDGLAMSSRNAYLTKTQRRLAPALYLVLDLLKTRIRSGANLAAAINAAKIDLTNSGFDKIDYVTAVDKTTLKSFSTRTNIQDLRVLGAVWLGQTRLIDNV